MDSSDSYCLPPLFAGQSGHCSQPPTNCCSIRPVFLSSNGLSLSLFPGQQRHSFCCLLSPDRSVFLLQGSLGLGSSELSFWLSPWGWAVVGHRPAPHSSSRCGKGSPGKDFWVQTPCHSACPQGAVGARCCLWLTLSAPGTVG